MKIYCLCTFTNVSDYFGFYGDRIVSTSSAIDDYLNATKERIFIILSKKPYLREYPVFVSVKVREVDDNGVFVVVDHFRYRLQINSDDSFDTIIIR